MAEGVGVTMEEVMKLVAVLAEKMNEKQHENMMAAIAEMKKPSEREQKELDAKDERIRQAQESRRQIAKAEEERKRLNALGCPHASYNPASGTTRHTWRAQVHTPGRDKEGNPIKPYFVPTCQMCHTQLPKILATTEMLTGGVNLDQYVGLDIDRLKKWAEQMMQAA